MKQLLSSAGIPLADAEVLLAHVIGVDRSWLLAHATEELPQEKMRAFHDACLRRMHGEPVAYIVGKLAFYGRDFGVTPDVLVPRHATEELVDTVILLYKKIVQYEPLQWHTKEIDSGIVAAVFLRSAAALPPLLVDVGTGSGCIAVSLACELPQARIIATDVSPLALQVARGNAERFGVGGRIDLRQGNLLQPLTEEKRPFFMVSNPPYVSIDAHLPEDVRREPASAIVAGPDGMDVLRPLLHEALHHPCCRGIAVECRADQAEQFPIVTR